MWRTTNGFSSFPFVYNWRKVERATSVIHCAPLLEGKSSDVFTLCSINIYVKVNSVCQERLQISKSSLPAWAGHPQVLRSQTHSFAQPVTHETRDCTQINFSLLVQMCVLHILPCSFASALVLPWVLYVSSILSNSHVSFRATWCLRTRTTSCSLTWFRRWWSTTRWSASAWSRPWDTPSSPASTGAAPAAAARVSSLKIKSP